MGRVCIKVWHRQFQIREAGTLLTLPLLFDERTQSFSGVKNQYDGETRVEEYQREGW